MATQTKINRPIQDTQVSRRKRGFNQFLIAMAVLVTVLITSACATVLPASENEIDTPLAGPQQLIAVNNRILPVAENEVGAQSAAERTIWDHPRRPNLIEAEASVSRAFKADAARYTAMAEFYTGDSEASVSRALETNAARYTGLAAFYAAGAESPSTVLASNPELAIAQHHAAIVEWNRRHHPGR